MDKELKAATKLLGRNLVCHLARTLARARVLHPSFASTGADGVDAIVEVALELILAEGREMQNERALELAAACVRFLRVEYDPVIGRDMPYGGGMQLTGAWIDESSLLPEPEKLDFEPETPGEKP